MPSDEVLLNFGDVFAYRGEDYVYLAESPENGITYAARILNSEHSRELNNIHERQQSSPNYNLDSLVYSFVVLSSAEYRDQLAWFRGTGTDGTRATQPHTALENDDLKKIKDEILTGPLPEDLKEKIRLTTSPGL